MNSREGVTPSRPRPQPRPSSPEKPKPRGASEERGFNYVELPKANRRRVREILGPALRAELAEYMAERAAEHVRAA